MHTYVERTDGYANVVQVLVQQKAIAIPQGNSLTCG